MSTAYLLNLFLMFVRILAVFMTAPVFSSRNVPSVAKIGFAALLTMILSPVSFVVTGATAVVDDFFPFLLTVAQEVLIGVLIGFISNLMFLAVAMGSSLMGMQVGFGAASMFNPLVNVSSAAFDQFYTFMVMAMFLAIDGHHWLLKAIAQTFELIPPGTFVFSAITVNLLVSLTNAAFVAAVHIALPVVGSLILMDVGLGLIARAVPQVQVFFLSLPLKISLGLLALAVSLPITLPLIKQFLQTAMTNIMVLAK